MRVFWHEAPAYLAYQVLSEVYLFKNAAVLQVLSGLLGLWHSGNRTLWGCPGDSDDNLADFAVQSLFKRGI